MMHRAEPGDLCIIEPQSRVDWINAQLHGRTVTALALRGPEHMRVAPAPLLTIMKPCLAWDGSPLPVGYTAPADVMPRAWLRPIRPTAPSTRDETPRRIIEEVTQCAR